MPRRRRNENKLSDFSYRIFQIKFVVFEAVLLGVFLCVLFKLLKGELGW
jgi:hypothetical protein